MFKSAIVPLGILCAVASQLANFPNHLSYFNELAGGPANGHRHLLHSNVDWGQDFYLLRDWIDRHQVTPATVQLLAYARIGEQAAPLIGLEPFPEEIGWSVVSATKVFGPKSEWKHQADRAERIGHSLYIFEGTEQ